MTVSADARGQGELRMGLGEGQERSESPRRAFSRDAGTCSRVPRGLTKLRWQAPSAWPGKRVCLGLVVTLSVALSGCAYFWEDITAHSPEGGFVNDMKYRLRLLLNPPDPLEVLAHSRDGDFRARAYRQVREPRDYGGSEEDQQKFIEGLIWGAKHEPDAIARIAAIERLAECKDPRAREFFFSVENTKEPVLYYDRDLMVQMTALQALGRLNDPRAIPILAKAAQFGASLDVRLHAVRALRNYPSMQAAQALVEVLRDEERKPPSQRQVALQHEVRECLGEFTGRDFPAEAQPWADYLAQNPQIPGPNPNPLLRLVSWWEGR
ncbi:MAG: HEAT repeat domain-containing protein [Gemmatales bacterium]|nr:HEAT repeat domain-containing protein [Gemmatales bacterium]MDW7995535.1 HEAT repeat domain-containing protein [Gemmatales bacterium]